MKNTLLKITAWLVLIWCAILGLGVLSLIFVIIITIHDANLIKLVFVSLGLVILAALIFVVGLGFFEFMTSFVKVKEEIEEIESDKSHPQINTNI